jgi:hypothetical protein
MKIKNQYLQRQQQNKKRSKNNFNINILKTQIA